jgi:hypothetical protein
VAAAGGVYRSRRGELSYESELNLGFTLQDTAERRFCECAGDYDEKGGRFSLSWLFSDDTRPYAFAQYMMRKFSNTILQAGELIHEEDIERRLGAGVSYRLSRSLTVTGEAGREQRHSNVEGASYVDRRAMLLFGYSTGPLYSARSRR